VLPVWQTKVIAARMPMFCELAKFVHDAYQTGKSRNNLLDLAAPRHALR
jgi:hypothetical protein